MKAPAFWQRGQGGMISALLRPAGWLYQTVGRVRQKIAVSENIPIPVICVGNVVAGGAGKTPVAIGIGQRLVAAGIDMHFLSRGYGGRMRGPHRVDAATDRAGQVGDEPLLLARVAPTWIARDRVAGAAAIVDAGGKALIMDDGMQNASVHKDVTFCVIDGSYGIGNGRVMPAGPLRESLADAVAKATAVVLMGTDKAGIEVLVHQFSPHMLVLKATLEAKTPDFDPALQPVHAFAGIGHPEKFFDTLRGLGCQLAKTTAFADHHAYSEADLRRLVADAASDQALLLTTEKDYVRLEQNWRDAVTVLPVSVRWQDDARLDSLLKPLVFERP